MPHCDPEQLALAALREPLPPNDEAHLADCAECQAEVASLQRSVDVLAVPALAAPGAPVQPPPGVWAAIAAATGVEATPASVPPPNHVQPLPAASSGADVVPLRRRGAPARRWLAVAAALLVGGVVGAGAVAVLRDGDGTVVATAGLDPLDGVEASGRAEVREAGGHRSLQVELAAPAPADGYYEVWLLRPDVSGMVQVGVVTDGATSLPLPDGVDLAEYPVVDVSIEPLDGDPTHSGVSVARGELGR
ncbi:anti-sigma factor domain-containing protein [Modestobacter roseus]|uniref:anti-sigma factor domain-containing protein n=1 Tax=Modestobacter roseus TaxID=1181884 RepID=UPI0034E00107